MQRVGSPTHLQLRTIPSVLAVTVKTYLYFLFTTFSVGLVTNISKSICGRLRPNFLDVCRPDWTAVKCETADGRPNYVTGRTLILSPKFLLVNIVSDFGVSLVT